MKRLNQIYFIIFILFLSILQYVLYDRTLRMDRLQKGTIYIQELSKNSLPQFSTKSYQEGVKKLKKDSKSLFTNVYVLDENGDKTYPFIVHRKLINSSNEGIIPPKGISNNYKSCKDPKISNCVKLESLSQKSLHHKQIYDSCDQPNKIFKTGPHFLIAQKVNNRCFVFQTSSLSLGFPNFGPLWYALIAIVLIIFAFFVIDAGKKGAKLTLTGTLWGSAVLYLFINYADITIKSLSIDKDIAAKLSKVSEVTSSHLIKLSIVIFVLLILFSLFYNTKFSDKTSETLTKYKTPYLYILPGGVGIVFLSFVPLISGVVLSFFQVKYNAYHFVWFDNYIDIIFGGLKDIANPEGFYFTLFITILWTTLNIFFHVMIGMAIALVLNRKGLKFKKLYSIIFIIPWAIPNYITALIWKSMFHKQFGAINTFLGYLGIDKIGWFSETTTAFMANLLTNIWLGFPFMMVMTLGALQSIPTHLYDAAVMDGASKWQQFKYVTLPMLKPALLPSIILGTIWTFNMFNVIYLVSGGEPNSSTDILITEAYRWAFERNGRYGYSAAYATIIFLVLFLYNQITEKIQKRGEA